MSNSKLVSVKVPAHSSNYTKGRSGKKITKITIHHMAGVLSAKQCGAIFQKKGRNGSSHYGIGNGGEIGLYVDEKNTAWCDSNWNSNCTSVTIETSNNKRGGDWTVGDKALKSLINLCADIAKRNNLGKLVVKKNLTYHSMYANTTCPGNYLRSKMQYIADEANKINYPPKPEPTPTPTPKPSGAKFKIGDKVIINGYLYKSSTAKLPSGKVKNKKTKITRYAKGSKHPYNTTGDLGWMNEKDIKKQ